MLVEDLGHQPLVADGHDVPVSRRRCNPRRLLATMLQREQGEVSESGDVVIGTVDAEDAALVAWPVAMVGEKRHG